MCLAGAVGSFVLYFDEVRPGNIKRPGKARLFTAIYWTIMQLPAWFRVSEVGWIPLCYILATELATVPGGISGVCEAILLHLWSENSWNFETTGMRIPNGGMQHFIKLVFKCFLADEKALKEVCNVKGAAGWKPCLCCANICNMDPERLQGQDWAQHYTCGDPTKFDQYTCARFQEMLNHVRATMEAQGSAHHKDEYEKLCGINFDNGVGLVWGSACDIAKVPDSVYFDMMHNVFASGGIAQYEVNQFVRTVKAKGIALETLQEFIDSVSQPGRKLNLKLKERVVDKDGKHIRAFASEVLVLVHLLSFFATWVLEPEGHMQQHVKCLALLAGITDILFCTDPMSFIALLRNLLVQHHDLYVELYPDCAKPKVHYLLHLPDHMLKFGVLMSCFQLSEPTGLVNDLVALPIEIVSEHFLPDI